MGRKKKEYEIDCTVKIVEVAPDSPEGERWFRMMADLLFNPKWDPSTTRENTASLRAEPSEAEQLSARLDMACGLTTP